MSERHNIIAFLSTLIAIVLLVALGAYMAGQGKSTEALGIGGAVTGLIGVIGTFKPRTGSAVQDDTLKTAVDKIPPTTTDQP